MKMFMALLATETNTFSPFPTGRGSFEHYALWHGDASRHPESPAGAILAEWRRLAEADGHDVAEGLAAAAQPGGRTVRSVYEAFREEIIAGLEAAKPVDMVLLSLHGAMAAVGYDDCEGDLLSHVRACVGPDVVIGAELDLHCHMTPRMVGNADVIVAFKEYPHVDELARGRELYRICSDAAAGRVNPTTAVFDCRMISMWRTTQEPMKSFVARLKELERRNGVLSASFGHGFPWADVPDVGARLWVITDDDPALAHELAGSLGREIYAMREATAGEVWTIDAAIDRALSLHDAAGPIVLADVADNAGGGAASDSTFILERLVARGISGAAIGCIWDPLAVELCREAGTGTAFALRLGGKCGPASGPPLDLTVEVVRLAEAHCQSGLSGTREDLGASARVRAGGIDIVIVSKRTQTFSPDAFSGLGLDLAARRIVVVKSTQNFFAQFAPLATEILYVTSPGAIAPDFAAIPYTARDGNYWPRVADPLAAES